MYAVRIEEQQGYGYQFWRCRNNGFAMYGMGGQLAICLPDFDFILATNADNEDTQQHTQRIFGPVDRNIPVSEGRRALLKKTGHQEKNLRTGFQNLRLKW